MSATNDIGKYLGVPIVHRCPYKHLFAPLFQKMDVALASWKTHMLSLSGKVVLAKYVLNALPNHVCNLFTYLGQFVTSLINEFKILFGVIRLVDKMYMR